MIQMGYSLSTLVLLHWRRNILRSYHVVSTHRELLWRISMGCPAKLKTGSDGQPKSFVWRGCTGEDVTCILLGAAAMDALAQRWLAYRIGAEGNGDDGVIVEADEYDAPDWDI
jgi:hypothetical protein